MNDFRLIKFRGEPFTIHQFNLLHEKAFAFIANEVKKEGRKIVITHHLPSYECNIDKYKGSLLNEAFCVDKTDFILQNEIDYWVYGHSHGNKADFQIGETTMVANQFGYVDWNEHNGFDYEKVIELK